MGWHSGLFHRPPFYFDSAEAPADVRAGRRWLSRRRTRWPYAETLTVKQHRR